MENRMDIWGKNIPGNSIRPKSEIMDIRPAERANKVLDTVRWILALKGNRFENQKKAIDTYTANYVMKSDPNYRETFEDVPYLIPYIAEGSQKAVIVVPGGGYCVKVMESEGTLVAERLQQAGITAFVLWYRTNPYYQPLPLMDLQRAIRLVRMKADAFGYAKNEIGAIGFSAGGAQVGMFLNLYQGRETTYKGYMQDEVDRQEDSLNFAALVYPALSYRHNSGTVHLNDQNGIRFDQDKSFGVENLRQAFNQVKMLVDNKYYETGNYVGLDVKAMRTTSDEDSYEHLANSLELFKALEKKVEQFDSAYADQLIAMRKYEQLELYVNKIIMGIA